jgi:hypothetical protein
MEFPAIVFDSRRALPRLFFFHWLELKNPTFDPTNY